MSLTAHTELEPILQALLAGAQAVLGEQFIGLYLHGSLATGDFNPETSDLDFVCVTTGTLSAETIRAIEALHLELQKVDKKWAYQLEGSYIPRQDLRRYNPADGPYPCVHEGNFYLAGHESHWILQRYILRKQGVILAGPEPKELIDPVSAEDLRGAIGDFLREWWLPMLENPSRLEDVHYQVYAVLTMCRMLYTLTIGEIASKPVSARWVQENFPAWASLSAWALVASGHSPQPLTTILDLIRFTAQYSQEKHFTSYPEVNLVLDELLMGVQSILGANLIGMYLYGSLTTGGFDRDSDVDYVVVTNEELTASQFAAIEALHNQIKTRNVWCADQLEGSYIPLEGLKNYNPQRALFVHLDRGPDEHLHRMQLDDEPISRAWWGGWVLLRLALRENGIVLTGPDPKTLLDPIPAADVRQSALLILQGWAAGLLNAPEQISSRGYQSYTVLTLCRSLYTLQTGGVASKPDALRWAKTNLDQRWIPLIDRAWLGRQNPGLAAEPDDVNQTLEFIRYTIEQMEDKA